MSPDRRQAHLLVAEDNKVNRLLLTRNLEIQGHRVSWAENGRVALEMLRREPFDLLLLDMEMPELDGFELLETMHADLQLRDLPVLVTSALEGLANVVRSIELGADDYLHKPINPTLLRARINACLEKKRLRDQHKELLRRFATREVAQDLEISGFDFAGKRLRGTVMFADIRGFTSMVERQSPEDSIELLNSYYTLMFEAIGGQGGVVNQMIGDGLMALFGAPLPLAQPEEAAVRAARDMLELVALLNAERAREGKEPIAIGIGIATGTVTAGYTGTQERATYTCIGSTVNLAARLEAHTKAVERSVLMDAPTAEALSASFAVEPLGPTQFKGLSEPLPTFAARFG